jgi:hypothetical protein
VNEGWCTITTIYIVHGIIKNNQNDVGMRIRWRGGHFKIVCFAPAIQGITASRHLKVVSGIRLQVMNIQEIRIVNGKYIPVR